MFIETLPDPYKVVEDAKGDFEAFISKLHRELDDDVIEFAEHFTKRSRPDLARFVRNVMETDNSGGAIDKLEEAPEYELYFAQTSEVVRAIYARLLSDHSSNIFGHVQYIMAKRRALSTNLKFPMTPEDVPEGYGDLVSTIIWYPTRDARGNIHCRNCGQVWDVHNDYSGSCPDK